MKNQKIFYLIGKNIKNSKSPLIHNKLFELKGKYGYRYIIHEQNILPKLQDLAEDVNFGGMSMTMPYKKGYQGSQKVDNGIELVYQGKIAQNLKIINTIVKCQSEGKITFKGYNTDIYGIQKTLQGLHNMKNVVMIGAGATAQTFCNYFQQSQKCSKIFILNRTQSKIEQLKQRYNKATNYSNYNKQPISLIVNSLPSDVIKQSIQVYTNLIQSLNMQSTTSFMDVNYKSRQKILQPLIQKQGIKINGYSGLDMLVWQAIQQNQLFCQQVNKEEDVYAEFKLLKQICVNSLNQV